MQVSPQDRPALVLIDWQQGFEDIAYWGGKRNNPEAEAVALKLLTLWRQLELPIFHVMHCSTTPGSPLAPEHPGNNIIPKLAPQGGEPLYQKTVNSAFIGTKLEEDLRQATIEKLVVTGLTTDHCVSTSTRMAGNLGFETYLVEDATATFDKKGPQGQHYPAQVIHDTALASLHNEFAQVIHSFDLFAEFS